MLQYRAICLLLVALYVCKLDAQSISVASTNVDVDEDAGSVTVTVTHSAPVPALWILVYSTSDGTATAGDDYTAQTDNLVVTTASADITVPIINDNDFDPLETFILTVSLSTGPATDVTITINDDERIPVNLTQPANVTARESSGNVSFTISRNDLTTHDFNVTVNTVDVTAVEMEDFTSISNMTVEFAENEMSKEVELHIIDDILVESTEMFEVLISGTQIAQDVTVTVYIQDNDTPVNYHCGRGTSQQCLNGGTCMSDKGLCDCPTGFDGVNCAIETANVTTGCGCVNGTCMNDGTKDICICDPGFASELCDQIAYFHQCTSTGFSVCITPYSVDTFNGDIYVLGKQGQSECNLALASTLTDPDIADWCEGYAANIDYNGTCGELGPNEMGEITYFQLVLKVQYSSFTWRFTDEEVTFTCQYSNGSLQVGSGPSNLNNVGTSVQRENKGLVPAALSVTDTVGQNLPDPLDIGASVKFCVSVSQVPAFNAITIDRIVANNTRDSTDLRTLVLYDFGCVPAEAVGIITAGPYWSSAGENHTMCFEMEVFIFSHDSDLSNPAIGILIDFTVDPDPAAVTIHSSACPSPGRRKRETGSGEENTLGTTIYLINPDPKTPESFKELSSTCSCKQWLTPALIGLGTVCITLVVIIIVLSIAVFRRYKVKSTF